MDTGLWFPLFIYNEGNKAAKYTWHSLGILIKFLEISVILK